MKVLVSVFCLFLLVLVSCSRDGGLDKYIQIVDRADSIVFYIRDADTFIVTKKVESLNSLKSLKSILKRNIEPQIQRTFLPQYKILFYQDHTYLGALLISGTKENPFANFTNGSFSFGFKLTYGIGMSL